MELSSNEVLLLDKYRKLSTKELGKLGEHAFEKDCFMHGLKVSKACVEAYPYDYILDAGNNLYRIRIKTTINYDGNKYIFSTDKTSLVHGKWKTSKYTAKDVDYFYLYCPITDERFLIKSYSMKTVIRKSIPLNNQSKNINFAEDYIFDKSIEEIIG